MRLDNARKDNNLHKKKKQKKTTSWACLKPHIGPIRHHSWSIWGLTIGKHRVHQPTKKHKLLYPMPGRLA